MASERDCVDQIIRVSGKLTLSLPQTVALGQLVSRKWDRARAAGLVSNSHLTPPIAASFNNFTEAGLDEFRAAAWRALAVYAATLPQASDKWSRGFWQGFAASWAYAFSIAIVALIIELLGSDLITVLRRLFMSAR